MMSSLLSLDTKTKKKRAAGLVLLAVLLTLFLLFNRIPKLETVEGDLEAAAAPEAECFQGFCIEAGADTTLLSRWWDFSLTYLELVALGMTFAFLVAGATEAFLFPGSSSRRFAGKGVKGALQGLLVGPIMTLCSACIVPISTAFRRKGASIEATLSIVQGSATMSLPALIMAAMVFTPMLSGSRIVLSVLGALLIGPIVARVVGDRGGAVGDSGVDIPLGEDNATWGEALAEGFRHWITASVGYLIRLGPIMVLAGFASGLAIQWISPDTVSSFLGNNLTGVAIAATVGVLINVPLMFEIPLVAALLLVGMGTAPAATLLFAAAAGGPITFWGLARIMPKRATATFVVATWSLGIIGGVGVLVLAPLFEDADLGVRARFRSVGDLQSEPVTPFTNIAPEALQNGFEVWNDRPGVVVFDYDRDGDLDFYITAEGGHPNWLNRNEGDGTFTDVAAESGVTATATHTSGAVACDINNDGYQDLYVGGWGDPDDDLDFRSPSQGQGNEDLLFLNMGDGTFRDITQTAFGDDVNLRSATTIACADVDGDGWVDIYVGNLAAQDLRTLNSPSHPGHYNMLYRNNGDLTFTDVAEQAGVRGPQILMRDPDGKPIMFENPETGELYEGYDPTEKDRLGNRVGEPTGQTHSVLFFDYDDDGDPDLWVANDGDRLHLFRNDSVRGNVRFNSVARAMGIDKVGSWMGFALGDFDGDVDLDVFVTNIGYHPRLMPPKEKPTGVCDYHERFDWGTCLHFLLRNDGTRDGAGAVISGGFTDVAPSTAVAPSPWMPPPSLDSSNIFDGHEVPTGLAAYDFGFGVTFFDYDNDGDQDLYWLGSIARGEGPGGQVYPSAGRMLRGDGQGSFEDITVRANLLDIARVNYTDMANTSLLPLSRRITHKNHENGKGVAHGDLNGDGYVDLIGTNSSGDAFTGDPFDPALRARPSKPAPGPVFVWLNGGGENHWITLRLKGRMAVDGTGSNADGIGARVYIISAPDDGAEGRTQVQEVRAGSSYISMDSLDLEFGLGASSLVEQIVIFWPSGTIQTLGNVPVDQVLDIIEPGSA